MNVLYVEDNSFDVDLTRRELARLAPDINLEIAPTLERARAALAQPERFDLVMTDMRLPDGDGLTLLAEIRDRALPLAVVVVTGRGDEEIAVAALKSGADDYLVKHPEYTARMPVIFENALQRTRAQITRRTRPLRVLYGEHNATDVDLTRRHFTRFAPQIHLEIVHTLPQVWELLTSGRLLTDYDVLLLDYRMAGLTALDVLKEIRQERKLDLPVVLVTGQGDEEIAVQALKLGASDYIVKNVGYLFQLPNALENAFFRVQLRREQIALRESEDRFRRLAENAVDLIYRYRIIAPRGFEYVSPAATALTGFTPEEHYADPDLGFKLIHPDDRHILDEVTQGKIAPTAPVVLRWVRKDGATIWTEQRNVPIFDAAGALIAIEGIARDVTARVHAEEKIRELHAQTAQRLHRLDALHAIDTAITASLDLRVTLQVILDQAVNQLKVDAVAVFLFDVFAKTLEYAAARGFRSEAIARARGRLGEGFVGRALLERRTIQVLNLAQDRSEFARALATAGEDFATCYAVPLIAKGQARGALVVFQRVPVTPDAEWLSFLEMLAEQAAIAMDNLELFNRLQRSNLDLEMAYDSTLEGWSRALDLRDKETVGHTHRVVELTLQLARAFGIAETDRVQIRRGALLHDIGKMGIPDAILLKPGAFTPEEWEVMRRHPVYAHDLLSPIVYLRAAMDIPYCHHEKWDGTGYPRGLKGEAIPLTARIFAIVDVWDALRLDRSYRPAWSRERALEYIRDQSGKHFDPQVVQQFLKMMNAA
jgi:PAS domain S-box-containing protein